MPCYRPLRAYLCTDGGVAFVERSRRETVKDLELACGQCVGCRLERSRQWAVRCVHEASLQDRNAFITLTYAPEFLPVNGSLHYRDFQLFMKRLRKRAGVPVRFFMAGEYGDELGRPHFHACLFGFDFDDKVVFKDSQGVKLYTSRMLCDLWKFGHASVGAVTFESAAYVARYLMKKVTGDRAAEHYQGRIPEFCRMSLKPGIGNDWLRLYWPEVVQSGQVVVNGKECLAPKFYRRRLRKMQCYEDVDLRFEEVARAGAKDRSVDRLASRELVSKARAAAFRRKLT